MDDIPVLRFLEAPEGLYIPARAAQPRRSPKTQGGQQRASLDVQSQYGTNTPPRPVQNEPPRQTAIQPAAPSSSYQLRPILPAAVRPPSEDPSRPQLAPLEYLQNITPPKRHDIDDDYLRQFRHVNKI